MTDLTFVYRSDPNPRPLQFARYGFMFRGSIQVTEGTYLINGRRATSTVVRPLAFPDLSDPTRTSVVDPGAHGYGRIGFSRGRVSLRSPVTVLMTTASPTMQFLNGRVTLTVVVNGALAEFAIWGSTLQEDPRDFYVDTATDTNSGGVTQPWTRMSAVFVPHKNARYLSVGARVYSVPNTGANRTQYFKKWMVQKAAVGDTVPSPTYSPARSVKVTLRPTRTLSAAEIAAQTPVVQRILDDNVPLGIGIEDPVWINP